MSAVAVVTGGGRGLGAALAEALVEGGHRVAVCATHEPRASRADLRAAVDVRDWEAVDAFAADARERLGPIDLWINNAGVLGPTGPVQGASRSDWELAVAVNLLGAVAATRALLSPGRRAPEALLVNIASRAARRGAPGLAAYAATKAALVSLSESVAAEEAATGLRVVAVIPPSFDTDMQRAILGADPDLVPGALDARRRLARGAVRSAGTVARQILDATLGSPLRPGAIVIDLTGDGDGDGDASS